MKNAVSSVRITTTTATVTLALNSQVSFWNACGCATAAIPSVKWAACFVICRARKCANPCMRRGKHSKSASNTRRRLRQKSSALRNGSISGRASPKIGRSLQLKGVTICRTPTDPSFSRMSGSMKFCRSGSTGSRL